MREPLRGIERERVLPGLAGQCLIAFSQRHIAQPSQRELLGSDVAHRRGEDRSVMLPSLRNVTARQGEVAERGLGLGDVVMIGEITRPRQERGCLIEAPGRQHRQPQSPRGIEQDEGLPEGEGAFHAGVQKLQCLGDVAAVQRRGN